MSDISKRIEALTPEQRELLTQRLKHLHEQAGGTSAPQLIGRRNPAEPAQLSFAQHRFWFLDQLEPGHSAYHMPPEVSRLRGALNLSALQRTLTELVRRHETLRTTFAGHDGQPVQVIHEAGETELAVVDLSTQPDPLAEAFRWLDEEAKRPFDLSEGPLVRAHLLRLGTDDHILAITMHHIISDGWSAGVMLKEIETIYAAYCEGKASPLAELAIQYADFAAWQRQWLTGQVLADQLAYWTQQLAGAPPVLELPTDRARPLVQSFHGRTHRFEIPKELYGQLQAVSRGAGATPFMTLLAAFDVLLWRYTDQPDIVVGSPISGRNWSEVESLIGVFINTLAMRTDLSGNPTFIELLGRVRETSLNANANQDVPFEKLVEELQPERSLSYSPVFQVIFVLQNAPRTNLQLSGLTTEDIVLTGDIAKVDLLFSIVETSEVPRGYIEYNTDLFDDATITRLADHYLTLLKGIVARPDQRIGDLPLLTATERQQLLTHWNDTRRAYPSQQGMHDLVGAQAARTPEAVAVVCGTDRLTYRELDARANQLARYLRARGVGAETPVAVMLERSTQLVVALLGVLKAGGAYVPLDPAYPQERLRWMIEDTSAPVILTETALAARVPTGTGATVLLDAEWARIAQERDAAPEWKVNSAQLAYIIYTSGSTGKPKGVAITHRSAVIFIHWAREIFTAEELAGVLASTSVCFDLSVYELFVTLSWGGKVIVVDNVLELLSAPAAAEVTLVNTVPSAISELLNSDKLPASVRVVNLAGEALPWALVQRIYEQTAAEKVFNLYGPSEDTTYSTFALIKKENPRAPSIGPVANTQVYLLDGNGQPTPVGIAGDLHLGGDGLARGYLNRPELTAERFIPDPFSSVPGGRLYRTGDLARYLPDGEIEYLGRLDHQVKLRGFRIELGEIEAALRTHSSVREAVVVMREDAPDAKRIVAYIVGADGQQPQASELRVHLKQRLPEYMVPSAFVMLAELPLTPNGKLNRKALPVPEQETAPEKTFVPPQNETEEVIADVWCNVLRRDAVGIHDNFFELGGHSLLAMQVSTRLRDAFQIKLTLRNLFEATTVAELALLVLQKQAEQTDADALARLLAELEQLAPTSAFQTPLAQSSTD